jgi:ABC-type multidrug transport system ATPase subunit
VKHLGVADNIIVLDEGRIAHQGPLAQLRHVAGFQETLEVEEDHDSGDDKALVREDRAVTTEVIRRN